MLLLNPPGGRSGGGVGALGNGKLGGIHSGGGGICLLLLLLLILSRPGGLVIKTS